MLAEAWKLLCLFLQQRGDRITQTRRIVLDHALQREDHFLAAELAAELAEGPHRVSRGTVYRTLALLVEAGLVRELRDGDMHVHYEAHFGRDEHEHMICTECGAFLEFSDPALARRIHAACAQHHFTAQNHRVTVFGLCSRCRPA